MARRLPPLRQWESVQSSLGLCHNCIHAKLIRSDRGSEFLQCQLSFTDPAYPKYPRLPVLTCPGHVPATNDESFR